MRVYLLELYLVRSDRYPCGIKDEEAAACRALVDRADE